MLDFIKEKQDVWQILQLTDKPVVLYGMGNGADQIIDLCDRLQIKVAGIFASDEFVLRAGFSWSYGRDLYRS